MHFGKSVGVACASFAITNIDDMFVLVTFFSEATTSKTMTPLRITLGQFIGFTVIVIISMIGFGVSYVIPTEPIGFLGYAPMLIGVWRLSGFLVTMREEPETDRHAAIKSTLRVSIVTVMNGGDNISTYVPLFSQAKKAEIAVYVVTYYILLGVWCLVAFMVMREKHILSIAKRYMHIGIPFLYVGLGLYIIIKSSCYPWSIVEINHSVSTHPGKAIMSTMTVFLLLTCTGLMLWFRLKQKAAQPASEAIVEETSSPTPMHAIDGPPASV